MVRPSATQVERQLAVILSSEDFVSAPNLRRMLTFIVEAWIAGEDGKLKAYTIGTMALGRRSDFDPQTDTLVRVTGSRLRKALDAYAAGAGRMDPLRITLGPHGYAPRVEARDEAVPPEPRARPMRPWLRWGSAIVAIACVAAAAGLLLHTAMREREARRAQESAVAARPAPGAELNGNVNFETIRPQLAMPAPSTESLPEQTAEALRSVRRAMMISLRRFDDILDVVDREDPLPDADVRPWSLVYVLQINLQPRQDRRRFAIDVVHRQSGRVVWTSDLELPLVPTSTKLQEVTGQIASRLARPYGVIANDALAMLGRNSDWQNRYVCQMALFTYWRDRTPDNFERAVNCTMAGTASASPQPLDWTNSAFLHVEAYRRQSGMDAFAGLDEDQLRARALAHAQRAVAAAPESARAHSALSTAQVSLGNLQSGLISAQMALKLNPNDPELRADAGTKHVQVGDYAAGAELLDGVLADGPPQPPWRIVYAALAHLMLGETHRVGILARELVGVDEPLALAVRLAACSGPDQADCRMRTLKRIREIAQGDPAAIYEEIGRRLKNADLKARLLENLTPLLHDASPSD